MPHARLKDFLVFSDRKLDNEVLIAKAIIDLLKRVQRIPKNKLL